MLRTRVLTALVGIPLALAVIFAPGGGLMAFALSMLALLGALEYRRAYLHADWIPQPRPNLILLLTGACLPLLFWRFPQVSLASVLLPALALAALYELARAWRGRRLSLAANLGYGTCSGCCISAGCSASARCCVGTIPLPPVGLAGGAGRAVDAVAARDALAGRFGRVLCGQGDWQAQARADAQPREDCGRLPRQPCAVCAGGLAGRRGVGLPLGWAIAGGLGVGILGQIGDLFESALKRAVGIKDFGGILPGHGGVLDRFDSFLFSAPWVWWVAQHAS
jgi:phosphatidate cytidylyltransferase